MTDSTISTDWLQARHNKWNTPPGLINEYVRKTTGGVIAHTSRVIAGLDNEVYDVVTTNHHQLIVRISHQNNHRFEVERWALNAARNAGVPTPHVLLIEQAAYDDTTVTFCIEEKLPGKPLDVLFQDGVNSNVNKAIDQIGEVLSKLHSVRVDGFGYLQPDGKGEFTSFAERMLTVNTMQAKLYEAADKWHLLKEDIAVSLALLNKHREWYQFDTPVLIHGDFVPKHILVDGDHINGVIDMQDCAGGHPVFDFVTWDMYWGERIPTSRIMAPYGNKSLFNSRYDTLFHLVLLRASLIMLMVNAQQDNPNDIQRFINGLKRVLAYFAKAN